MEDVLAKALGALAPQTPEARLRAGGDFHPSADLDSMLLARKIRAARAFVGWTQADLAREAGVKEETVRRIERATGNPAKSTVSRVMDALARAGVEFLFDAHRKTNGVRWRWE